MFMQPIIGARYRVHNPAEDETLIPHEGKVVKVTSAVMMEIPKTANIDFYRVEREDTGEILNLYEDELGDL